MHTAPHHFFDHRRLPRGRRPGPKVVNPSRASDHVSSTYTSPSSTPSLNPKSNGAPTGIYIATTRSLNFRNFSDSQTKTMRALLIRTSSVPDLLPVHHHSFVSGSPRVSLSVHDFIAKNGSASRKFSLHLEAGRRRNSPPATGIRRASSETELIRSESRSSSLTGAGSRSFPARIPEQEYVGDWTQSGVAVEELGFPGGGIGKGRNSGSGGGGGDDWNIGNFTGGNADRSKIGAYYQEMLKSDPNNSLLLRNYGRFLHEVEGDVVKAEECYGRAILSSPGDGEVLALYGKLIWENERDEDRAKCYFDQAVHSSPHDCMVMGSYAKFMWEAEDEGDEEGGDGGWERENGRSAAVVEAF